ncbi:MAG: MFS transporter, partial [Planctomycetota bacterium]
FIIAMLAVISFASPQTQLGWIAIAAVACTFASTSQDVLIDAWRIEVADEETTIDILSSVYQIGYRLAAILGGAGALIIAARIGWNNTFVVLAAMMAIAACGVFVAENSPVRQRETIETDSEAVPLRRRNIVLLIVLFLWAASFYAIFSFMGLALSAPDQADARAFTREKGPLIVFASVIAPVIAAAVMLRWRGATPGPGETTPWRGQTVLDVFYSAIVAPMVDIVLRLRYAAILVLGVALTYRFVDLIWGGLAYPFYLGENYGALGHSLDEVAIASKLFGTLMTFLGIGVGGAAIIRFGRMPCLFVGAILAASTNLLFADLAAGGATTHAFMSTLHLYGAFSIFQPLADF